MPFPSNYQQSPGAPTGVVSANDVIQAVGAFGTSAGYASDAAATQRIGALWGVGFGSRGYGQSTFPLTPPAIGDTISGTIWSNMRSILFAMAQHHNGTGSPTTQLPPATAFSAGQTITAFTNPPTAFSLPAQLTTADTNRNTFASPAAALASTTSVASAWTVTRATSWGNGSSETITCVVNIAWPSEDQARYFFNSGGLITLTMNQPGSGSKAADWQNTFTNKLGSFAFGINSSVWTGTWAGPPPSPVPIGYYQLTPSAVTIFNGTNIGESYYSVNDMYIQANYVSSPTALDRGARGSNIRITIILTDEHAGPSTVPAGTSVTFGYRIATTYLSGIATPAFSTITPF